MKAYFSYLTGNILLLLFISVLYFPEGKKELKNFASANPMATGELIEQFRLDENHANEEFLNKYFYITGTAKISDKTSFMLSGKILCYSAKELHIQDGDSILVYGKCLGYDSLFDNVKFETIKVKPL